MSTTHPQTLLVPSPLGGSNPNTQTHAAATAGNAQFQKVTPGNTLRTTTPSRRSSSDSRPFASKIRGLSGPAAPISGPVAPSRCPLPRYTHATSSHPRRLTTNCAQLRRLTTTCAQLRRLSRCPPHPHPGVHLTHTLTDSHTHRHLCCVYAL
jgi:hypothetical protein